MVRLFLIDRKSHRVCADTSAHGLHWRLWKKLGVHNDDVEGLAAAIARLLDKSLGKSAKDYVFMQFTADHDSDGYLVFDCTGPRLVSNLLSAGLVA
ncbi:MAG: hypothetical protein ACXW3J_04210 [Methylocystis sp.]